LSSPTIVGVAYVVNSTSRSDVETVDRLDQPDGRDLDEVVDRLAAVAEPARQVLGEVEVHLDELVARLLIAV